MYSSYLSNNFFNCKWCNRKYKTEKKFESHVETQHPYVALNENNKKLSLDDRLYLLNCFQSYSQLLLSEINITKMKKTIKSYFSWDGESEISEEIKFVWSSHMLNPTSYSSFVENNKRPEELKCENRLVSANEDKKVEKVEKIERKELKRMVKNHLVFRERVKESSLLQKALSDPDQLNMMFSEFERFLNLGQPWQGDNFCPSLVIDLIWHSSMMHPKNYKVLCTKFIGKTLSHCLLENENNHDERYVRFEKQFQYRHKKFPVKIEELILSDKNNAIEGLFQKFREEQLEHEKNEEIKRQENLKQEEIRRQENLRQEQIYKKQLAQIEEQKRNGAYVYQRSLFDDGKC